MRSPCITRKSFFGLPLILVFIAGCGNSERSSSPTTEEDFGVDSRVRSDTRVSDSTASDGADDSATDSRAADGSVDSRIDVGGIDSAFDTGTFDGGIDTFGIEDTLDAGCIPSRCPDPDGPGTLIIACCTSAEVCGFELEGKCQRPGDLDATVPDVTLPDIGLIDTFLPP